MCNTINFAPSVCWGYFMPTSFVYLGATFSGVIYCFYFCFCRLIITTILQTLSRWMLLYSMMSWNLDNLDYIFANVYSEEWISSRRNHCARSDRRHREIEPTRLNYVQLPKSVSSVSFSRDWYFKFNMISVSDFVNVEY